jgi:MFS family permease
MVGLVSDFPWLLVGWALVGAGLGNVSPQVYAAAAHAAGARGLTLVMTFGNGAAVFSPALMGAVITLTGIQRAMFVPAAGFMTLAVLSRFLPGRRAGAPPASTLA